MERLAFIIAILILLFSSCTSCIRYTERVYLSSNSNTTWPYYLSVAMVTSTPTKKGKGKTFLATAWAIDKDYMMTAGHFCVRMKDQLKKKMTGKKIKLLRSNIDGILSKHVVDATIFAVDEEKDMCILKSPGHSFIPLILSSHFDLLQTGDHVTAIGAPRGLFPVRTDGYITQLKAYMFAKPMNDMMLVKIDIDHGNSGGPVFWRNEVIGMAVAVSLVGRDNALVVPVTQIKDFIKKKIR